MAKIILIIDDEMDTRRTLEKGLSVKGYSVTTACNGNDGIMSAKADCPDLIILDRLLGDMLGEEVANELKGDPLTENIPIIFLSVLFSKTDEAERGHFFGGGTIFTKPYDIEELVTAIEKLLSEEANVD